MALLAETVLLILLVYLVGIGLGWLIWGQNTDH